MRPVATYFGARRLFDKYAGTEIHWPKDYGPPMDVPECGFTGEAPHCLPKGISMKYQSEIFKESFLQNHFQYGLQF